jgi:hypothetical protein
MALPGISFEIVRSAGPVLGIRTDRTALLMLAARGPVETPVLVHSYKEFVDVFGCQVDGMLGALAAKAYYQNGGEELVVGRFVPQEAEAATAQHPVVGATTPGASFQLEARDVGAFGNRIKIDTFLELRKRGRAAAISAAQLLFAGTHTLFSAADVGLPIRLQWTGFDTWNRVDAVATDTIGNTQTITLHTALPSVPPDLIAELYERTFSLRIREPMRPDVIVDGLDLSNVDESNKLLERSVVRLKPPSLPGPELPMPDVVTTFSGGDDGLDPLGSTGPLKDSFERTLEALDVSGLPNMVAAPDLWSRVYKTKGIDRLAFTVNEALELTTTLIDSVAKTQDRIVIVDPPLGGAEGLRPYGPSELLEWRSELESAFESRGLPEARDFAATYTPWPRIVAGPVYRGDATLLVPPSAFVAGQMARTARERGPWVATGNVALEGLVALDQTLSADDQETLQGVGINPLRIELPPGVTIQGVRALAWPDRKPWRFISTRGLFNFLRRALKPIGLSYTFEPNSPATWIQLRRDIERLLRALFGAGALAGNTPAEAFFVRVDEALNPEPNRDSGVLTARIGVAPALPLEFLVVRLELARGITRVVEEPIAT